MKPDLAVVILAAGLGTRMKSRRAKVLHRAGGRALVEHVVAVARRLVPPERIFVVVGHQAEEVQGVLASTGVCFIHQAKQLGTGHAVLVGRKRLQRAAENLLVLYGDTPMLTEGTLRRLGDRHQASGAACTLLTMETDSASDYGRILRGPGGALLDIVERKACTPKQIAIREVNPGIYCFRAGPLFAHIGKLRRDNPAREYYLTDVPRLLRSAGLGVETLPVEPAEALGINTRAELAAMDARLRDRKARELMEAGVTIFRPETCVLDPDVEVGADSVLGPWVALYGSTRLGRNSTVRPFSTLRDCVLEDDVMVHECVWMEGARVAGGAQVGPFARLRPGTEIGPQVKIGSFVETKKARIGRATLAQHLAYLGDAVIGEKVNIGAGTITCNYDGEKKNMTVIEDNVFVGTNSSLVAPVRVGTGSYIAAGSVITEDVPPGALALGRARQVNKEGWVTARKKKAKGKAQKAKGKKK